MRPKVPLLQKVSDSKYTCLPWDWDGTEFCKFNMQLLGSRRTLTSSCFSTLVAGFLLLDESVCHCGNGTHLTKLLIIGLLILMGCSCEFAGFDSFISHREKVVCWEEWSQTNLKREKMVVYAWRETKVFTVESGKGALGRPFVLHSCAWVLWFVRQEGPTTGLCISFLHTLLPLGVWMGGRMNRRELFCLKCTWAKWLVVLDLGKEFS